MTDQQAITPRDLIIWGNKFRSQSKRAARATWKFIDFLGDGYRAYGDAIYDQMDERYYALGYLRNLVTTGLNFPPSRRVNLPQLSPSHFQVVNSIKDRELQEAALRLAADKGLTRNELREECKRRGLIDARDKTALELALDNHALAAENTIQARELSRANGRNHALEAELAAAIQAQAAARLADEPNAGARIAYERDVPGEWVTGRCPECHRPLVCPVCGEVRG